MPQRIESSDTSENRIAINGEATPEETLPPQHHCYNCGRTFRSVEWRELCNDCGQTYFVCSGCRNVRYLDERDPDTGICDQCSNVILDYSSKPTFEPIGNAPHLGVELELESNSKFRTHARTVLNTFERDFVIVKSDGSLSDYGFEICSRPASLEKHTQAWQPFFVAHASRQFIAQSYTSERCGLHVHISRNGLASGQRWEQRWELTEHTIALIVCFINLPKNKRFVEMIAGRHANTYTTFKPKRLTNAAYPTGDKYEAVNLSHRYSLEFRMFKGTLKAESFFKALQFVESLTKFCAENYNVRKALNVNQYIKYVYANVERYRLLAAFIDNRWYGKASTLTPIQNWSLYNNRKPPLPPVVLQGEGGR
jgi:hypothetical protein